MPDQTLSLTIKAVDQASSTLKAVSSAAATMGKTAETAGKQASAAFKDQAKSTDDLSKRMAAAGAAFTAGAALLGQWSRSAQDAAAIQRQLEASINATGDSYDTYAAQIEAVGARAVQLGQDDEAASQAISALTQITGSASVAVDNMGLVFDLAAAKGLSLENAAELVGKVIEGNTGILARYGIVVQEGASAEEALGQIQQQVAGQAEAHATSYARLREELSNVTDAIGGAVGGFAPFLAMLPALSSGMTIAGAAAGALAPGLTGAAAASKLLSVAMGPAGIVVAAGAAAVAIYEVVKRADDLDLSAGEAADGVIAFTDAIAGLGAGAPAAALADYVTLLEAIAAQTQANKVALDQNTQDQIAANSAIDEAARAGDEAGAEAAQNQLFALQDLQAQLDANIITQDQFNDLQADLLSIWTDQNPLNAGIVADELARLTAEWHAGTLLADDYVAAVSALEEHHKSYGLTLDQMAGKTKVAGQEVQGTVTAFEAQSKALADNVQLLGDYAQAITPGSERAKAFAADLDEIAAAGGEASVFVTRWIDGLNDGSLTLAEVESRASKLVITLRQQAHESYPGAERSMGSYGAMALETADILAKQTKITEESTAATEQAMTAEEQATQARRDTVAWTRAANTSMGDYGGQVLETADTLAKQTQITQELNAATAQTETNLERVARGSSSAAVQLAAFKDVQDGLIATGDVFNQQYAEYGAELSDIERAQTILNERVAEGIPITKEQQEFLDGAAAASERLAGGQEDAAIQAGIAAEQYGENMSAGDKMNASLDGVSKTTGDLTTAIRELIDALNGVPEEVTTVIKADDADAREKTQHTTNKLDEIDQRTATATITADAGDAIGDGSSVISILNSLDNRTVTSTIRTVIQTAYETTGSAPYIGGPAGGQAGGRDGGVMGYANGGVVQAELAEVGPERLKFRDGGMAIVRDHGVYAVPAGTFVTPTAGTMASPGRGGVTVQMTFTGPINADNFDEFLTEAERLVKARFAGLGL